MKGFWIPVELMELDISWTKRILLAEISQLEMLDKGCVASNSHFSQKLKISNQAVSKALNELAKDGLINIDNAQTKRNFGRKITINFSKSPIHKSRESKENKTNTPENQDLSDDYFIEDSFKKLWQDYSLTFLKRKGNNTGSKVNALKWYKKLIKFGASVEDIYKYCEHHAEIKFGHKYLENLLRVDLYIQYKEDN